MRVNATMDGLDRIFRAELENIAEAITAAMVEASEGLKEDLRRQTEAAGLGPRLAKSWQNKVYPRGGLSAEPAGYVYSKAPKVISVFATGAVLTPVLMNFLAIPTENVPRKIGGRGAKQKMSPRDVERHFGQSLIILRGRNGTYGGYLEVIRAKSKRGGFRSPTPGRMAQVRSVELIKMFNFVRSTKMPKLFDLQATADRWGAQVPALFDARMGKN